MRIQPECPQSLTKLRETWEHKCAGRAMPPRRDFEIDDLRSWLGRLLLLEVVDGGRDFRYRVYGSSLTAYLGAERNGQTVGTLPPEIRDSVMAEYRFVVTTRRPHLVTSNRLVGATERRLTKLILPLSEEGRTVNMLLAGVEADGLRYAPPDRRTSRKTTQEMGGGDCRRPDKTTTRARRSCSPAPILRRSSNRCRYRREPETPSNRAASSRL